MDMKLMAWARQVKSRRLKRRQATPWRGKSLPVLWLFSDPERLPDPRPAAATLPPGLCGVVLRHDRPARTRAERAVRLAAGLELAAICRARRIALQVAGDAWLAQAIGAGVHLRRGGGRRRWPPSALITSSAHGPVELRRARLTGAAAIFLSPCFETASHPGHRGLQALRWSALSRALPHRAGVAVLALGGVSGDRVRSLPRQTCAGAGAISALTNFTPVSWSLNAGHRHRPAK